VSGWLSKAGDLDLIGQVDAAPSLGEPIEQGYLEQLLSYFESGGTVMVPLIGLAMLLWFALGYRLLTLQRGNRRSVRVLVERYSKDYQRVPRGVIDQAVVLGLGIVKQRTAHLRRRLDDAFSGFELEIGRFAVLVRAIVAVAPLLGLLGTVAGMIETFDSLGDMSLFSQSGGIAGGISLALFSTQTGLAVAIPGLLVGRVLDHRQRAIEGELDKLKDILCTMQDEGAAA
jgi:biopolymer transport protein ExbB